jgi:hypothetical protein
VLAGLPNRKELSLSYLGFGGNYPSAPFARTFEAQSKFQSGYSWPPHLYQKLQDIGLPDGKSNSATGERMSLTLGAGTRPEPGFSAIVHNCYSI